MCPSEAAWQSALGDCCKTGLRRAPAEPEAQSTVEGFFVSQALRDADERVAAFRSAEANLAFERLTGIPVHQTLGRSVGKADLAGTLAHARPVPVQR